MEDYKTTSLKYLSALLVSMLGVLAGLVCAGLDHMNGHTLYALFDLMVGLMFLALGGHFALSLRRILEDLPEATELEPFQDFTLATEPDPF